MNLLVYSHKLFEKYLKKNIDNYKFMDTSGLFPCIYLCFPKIYENEYRQQVPCGSRGLFPQAVNRYLRRNVDTKSSMDPRVHFLVIPLVFDRYLRRNVDTESSMDLRVYFF